MGPHFLEGESSTVPGVIEDEEVMVASLVSALSLKKQVTAAVRKFEPSNTEHTHTAQQQTPVVEAKRD